MLAMMRCANSAYHSSLKLAHSPIFDFAFCFGLAAAGTVRDQELTTPTHSAPKSAHVEAASRRDCGSVGRTPSLSAKTMGVSNMMLPSRNTKPMPLAAGSLRSAAAYPSVHSSSSSTAFPPGSGTQSIHLPGTKPPLRKTPANRAASSMSSTFGKATPRTQANGDAATATDFNHTSHFLPDLVGNSSSTCIPRASAFAIDAWATVPNAFPSSDKS
mmetsp:Transcript_73956/g.205590  ORF Transcript_73956/g.205590 Transcript_73956/m.205590 type:complete len:215 (+) Transcript_73956:1031-1675(+)